MYNVVFIDIDKLEDNFQSSKEQINELMKLTENITNVSPDNSNIISIICNEITSEKEFKIALLESYFRVMSTKNPKIILGRTLSPSKPYFKDVDYNPISREEHLEYIEKKMAAQRLVHLDDYQYDYLQKIGFNNIENVIHISNGIDFFLHEKLNMVNNISLTAGYKNNKLKINIEDNKDNTITYLVSCLPDLKGYNDCFEAFFANRNVIKLSRGNN